LFNSVITGFGIFEAIRFHKLEKGKNFNYSSGFTVGVTAGFLATIIFTIFFLFYATEVNPDFLDELLTVFKREYNVGIGLVCFVVAIMGFATSVVLTLTFMQYFKNSNNLTQ
jgi:high-affinity Fe2+/Pb2+ permease